jgi:hypothetical protein
MDQDNGPDRPDSAPKTPVPERPGVPRWVKVFGLIALAIAVILAVLMLLGVEHGPGLHSRAESVPAIPAQTSVHTTPVHTTPAPTPPAPTAGTEL